MGKDCGGDLISDLPESILESILTRLPIRDAVKTSVLATRWRYRWASMTHLLFDDRIATNLTDRFAVQKQVVTFITKFLLLRVHDGPIQKFSISSSRLQNCPDVCQWLLHVSRRDVRELDIELGEDEWFRAPSCVFSLKKLVRLGLVRCELARPPHFRGFKQLKHLILQQVLIPPDDVERLISSCPQLENLTLSYFDSLELTIRAPKLKYLTLEGEFKDLRLAHTPHLVTVSVSMYLTDEIAEHFEQSSGCNYDKFLAGSPKLEKLIGHIYFTKYLSIGSSRRHRPMTHHHLKFLELYEVSFDDTKEVLVVLRLIVNSPNLKSVQISGSSNTSPTAWEIDYKALDKDFTDKFSLDELKTVKLTDVSGVPLEMLFIRFLLENSPGLEEMSITPSSCMTDGRLPLLVNLVSFRRASPRASIVFCS